MKIRSPELDQEWDSIKEAVLVLEELLYDEDGETKHPCWSEEWRLCWNLRSDLQQLYNRLFQHPYFRYRELEELSWRKAVSYKYPYSRDKKYPSTFRGIDYSERNLEEYSG